MTVRRRPFVAVAALLLATSLAACSTAADGAAEEPAATAEASDTAFPVTIEHAFGSTTIETRPERVATWGWGSTEASIAIGVTPVAIAYQAYAGDDEGVLPWVREAVEGAGDEMPTVLPDSGEEVPFEAIAAAEPDVILAQYSGLTQEQYDTLSAIAPVVAYPGDPWATPWRDVVTLTGDALGMPAEAEEVLAGIDAEIAEQREAHPEFEGLSLAAVWDGTTFYVYADEDPRVEFMLDLGFVSPESVDTLDTDESPFYFTLSHERLSELTSDVLVVYGTTQDEVDTFLAAPYSQVMPQVTSGAVAPIVGAELISAVSPPTALSLTWGLDEAVAALADAAAAARG